MWITTLASMTAMRCGRPPSGRPRFGQRHIVSSPEGQSGSLQRIVGRGVEPFPGALRLVGELVAERLPLAIASGALSHEIAMILSVLGLPEVFPITYFGGSGGAEQTRPGDLREGPFPVGKRREVKPWRPGTVRLSRTRPPAFERRRLPVFIASG